jgi:signal transduction histidine kinase
MMTAPVFDARGELLAVLGGAVDLLDDSVLGRTVHLHTGETGYFYLFDSNRTMILHPDPSRLLKQDIPPGANRLLDAAIGGFEGTGETVNSRGVRTITTFKHLRTKDWILGVNTPAAEAYAGIERARRTLALVVAATILAVVAVVWRLMSRMAGPLLAFTAHVEAIARKEGAARRVAIAPDDEVGQLAAAFNRMVDDLEAKEREVAAERERLVRAAQHWRATFDAIRDGVCVLDADLRVVHANRALRDLVGAGAPADALEGRPAGELLSRVLGEAAADDVAAGAGRALRRGGDRWFELQRDRIDLPGAEGGFVQLVSEVTQQQLLQEHLTQAQKMDAVGQLAGGVAHDFNNLLSVILAFASSLREELADPEQRASAEEIERAGLRASALTRQLLAFSRRHVAVPEVLDVAEVVENLAHMIERVLGERIRLRVDVAETAAHVSMDPSLLEQVLVNLSVNARDAMPEGGELAISARDEVIAPGGAIAPGRYVALRVSDSGTGMDAATLARAFEPFFTTKPRGKGTGLGLAMVYGAVEQSGGRIDVASAPGTGTTFTVRLPRVDPPAATPVPRPDAPPPRGRGERILVVEDEPQLRATVCRFLSAAGYDVVAASNGEEGLGAFRARADGIDLVLTDVVMPGAGGLALGRAIGEVSAVPVLYMSGYSDEVASGREHIAPDVFLQKPFDRATLLGRVGAALASPQA